MVRHEIGRVHEKHLSHLSKRDHNAIAGGSHRYHFPLFSTVKWKPAAVHRDLMVSFKPMTSSLPRGCGLRT